MAVNTCAVVVLNYNGAEWLRRLLPTIIQNTPKRIADLYVIDNASRDESRQVIQKYLPNTHTFFFDINKGYAAAYNEVLGHISATHYVLLNNDVKPASDWLLPLLALMKDPTIGACQPKIRSLRAPTQFDYAGAAGGYIDRLGYTFCRGRVVNTIEEDRGQYDTQKAIFWASGCCLLVRSDAFWAVGGLDERFFMHMEEVDLCWRLQCAGYTIKYCPDSVVYHWGGAILNYESARKTYYNFRNNWLMLVKNLPIVALLWLLPMRLLSDMGALGYFLYKRQWQRCLGILQAFAYLASHLHAWLWARTRVKESLKHPLKQKRASFFLMKQYFIHKEKTYSALVH